MRDAPRLGGHFTPSVHEDPANETTRPLVVSKITGQRAEEQPDVLIQRIQLVLQRLARAEQIAGNFAVHLQQKTRFWFVVGVIGRQKVREQFAVLVNRIDWDAEKSRITAKFSYRLAI